MLTLLLTAYGYLSLLIWMFRVPFFCSDTVLPMPFDACIVLHLFFLSASFFLQIELVYKQMYHNDSVKES